MRKGLGSVYDKWNISVVICDTDIQYKYVVNQKLEHVDDISFKELFGRIRVAFYKIRSVPS
jgi:hypothetical protein